MNYIGTGSSDPGDVMASGIITQNSPWCDVRAFGASGHCVGGGSINANDNTLLVPDLIDFAVGQTIIVRRAGDSGNDLVATITNISGQNLILDSTASTSVSSAWVFHDDTAAIQSAIDYVSGISPEGGTVFLPQGHYGISNHFGTGDHSILLSPYLRLQGSGSRSSVLHCANDSNHGSYPAITLCYQTTICNLRITGFSNADVAPGITSQNTGIWFGDGTNPDIDGSNSIVSNVYVMFMNIGIDVPSWDNLIKYCIIERCNTGISLIRQDQCWANDNVINTCRFWDMFQAGIHIKGGGNKILTCRMGTSAPGGITPAGSIGIWVQTGLGYGGTNLIMSNELEGATTYIQIENGGNTIIGNWFNMGNSGEHADIVYANGADDANSHNIVFGNTAFALTGVCTYKEHFLTNLGIGTTTPTAKLDINPGTVSNSNPNLRLRGTTSSIPSGGNPGDIQIYASGTSRRLYINISGTWRYATLS